MSEQSQIASAVEAYINFYERLTPESTAQLDELCTPEVRFRDPFNDVEGIAAYRAILTKMFADVRNPRFTITDFAISGQVAYLRWDFCFETRKAGSPWRIEGMTEVHFDEQGRVTAHLDHWDSGSQFYGRLPILRPLINLVRRRVSIGSP